MIRGIGIICLLVLCIGFGTIAALPWIKSHHDQPIVTGPAATDDPAPALQLRPVHPTDMTAFTDRPLFTAVRRPPPPEAPGTPLIDPMADLLFGEYEISGVVMLGDSAMAMLRDRKGRLTRLRMGDQIETRDGIAKVVKITLNRLTFTQGDDTVTAQVRREGANTE